MHRRTASIDGGPDSGSGAMLRHAHRRCHGPTRSRSPPQRRRSALVRGAIAVSRLGPGRSGSGVAPILSGLVSVLFLTHARYLDHVAGARHPERPARLEAVFEGVRRADVGDALVAIDPRPATRDELELIHPAAYLDAVQRFCSAGGGRIDPDTGASPRLLRRGGARCGCRFDCRRATRCRNGHVRVLVRFVPRDTTHWPIARWASACSTMWR